MNANDFCDFVSALPRLKSVNEESTLAELENAYDTGTLEEDIIIGVWIAKRLPDHLETIDELGDLDECLDICPPALKHCVMDRATRILEAVINPRDLIRLYCRSSCDEFNPLFYARFIVIIGTIDDIDELAEIYESGQLQWAWDSIVSKRFAHLLPQKLGTFSTTERLDEWFKKIHTDLQSLVVIAIEAMLTKES
jgi:hypothetical protein